MNRKYSENNASVFLSTFFPNHFSSCQGLISASLSSSSWGRIEAATKCWIRFSNSSNLLPAWSTTAPSPDTIMRFINWSKGQNLKASTVVAYMSSIKCIHGLLQQDTSSFSSPLVKAALRGLENLEIYKSTSLVSRKAMSLPLLKILGHEISKSNWSINSKRVFWSACCVAFYSSCRMGEILPKREFSHCPEDTLLWEDVRVLSKDHLLIHLKSTKTNSKGGDLIDLFPINSSSTCPVSALRGLRDSLNHVQRSSPVFSFSTGRNLTLKEFNSTVSNLLKTHLGEDSSQISGHSFRAAIPSTLAKFPELASSDEIMGWGRWKSSTYLVYTRLKLEQKKKIFSKIIAVLSA